MASMLTRVLLLAVLLGYINRGQAAPTTGSCLCLTATGVHVRAAANLHASILGSANTGDCYTFKGGADTADGYTWYEIEHAFGHAVAWIASAYVSVSSASSCQSGSSTSTGTSGFATGIVSEACLLCICIHESGCKPRGCHLDGGSNSCGYFQIKHSYWLDCGSPGSSWETCADDYHCSSLCVQNYMKRYAVHFSCPMTCEGFAREHNGGPRGCQHSATEHYWTRLQAQSGCHNVQ